MCRAVRWLWSWNSVLDNIPVLWYLLQVGTVQHNAEVNLDLHGPSTINTRPVQILNSRQVAVSMYLLQSVFLHLSAVNYTPLPLPPQSSGELSKLELTGELFITRSIYVKYSHESMLAKSMICQSCIDKPITKRVASQGHFYLYPPPLRSDRKKHIRGKKGTSAEEQLRGR